MASTIGTALGRTHGSWRPRASRVTGSLEVFTVSWADEMVAVGLNATRQTTSAPFEMPPCTPPDRLPVVVGHVGAGAFHRQEGDVAEGDPRRRVVRRQAQPQYAVAAAQVNHTCTAQIGSNTGQQYPGADIQLLV